MIFEIILISISGIAMGIFQSTFLSQVIPWGIVPDIAMLILIFSSWRTGALPGEISGFLIGISFDIFSLSPPGYYIFIYTILGYVFGKLKDSISTGFVIGPAVSALAASTVKYILAYLLSFVSGINTSFDNFANLNTLRETAANIILAPLFFLIVKVIFSVFSRRRGGFQ